VHETCAAGKHDYGRHQQIAWRRGVMFMVFRAVKCTFPRGEGALAFVFR